jgi:hypothetical protein
MRIDLLEKKLDTARREGAVQEQLYQEIVRDKEEVLARLQRRAKKKIEPLTDQISLSDLLKGQ